MMEEAVRISSNHKYDTLRDYETLWHLAQKTPVVCFLDYSKDIRDTATTLYSSGLLMLSARGISYIWAENLPEFKKQCEKLNVEFIPPRKSFVSKMFPDPKTPQ